MYTREEKLRFKNEAADCIFKLDKTIAFVAAIIILVTNLFWFLLDLFNIHQVAIDHPFTRFSMVAIFVVCIYMIIVCSCKTVKSKLMNFSLLVFSIFICLEVLALAVEKNIETASYGNRVNGINISTMYLFIIIFFCFPRKREVALVSVLIMLSLILPKYLSGKDAYFMTQNILLGICIVFASFIFRYLMWSLAKQNVAFAKEKELYHSLTIQSIATIANTIDAKDYYTHGHSRRVGEYAKELASRMGLSKEEQEDIYFAGLLHDIGKISVPREVLNKNGRLTDEEFALVKKHPLEGYKILKELRVIPMIAQASRWHHERIDGRGYPDGIRGDDLPMYAKIISVADCYDAMASERPYRCMLSEEFIKDELRKGKGSQFDPQIADKMLEMIAEGCAPVKLDDSKVYAKLEE